MVWVKRIDHTAVAVQDLDEAIDRWRAMTGARLESRDRVPDQGVEVAMLSLGDTTVELVQPLDEGSGVSRFLAKHGESLHHIGLEVNDIERAIGEMSGSGLELIDREPRRGVHGSIAFMDPRSAGGVLLELIEKKRGTE